MAVTPAKENILKKIRQALSNPVPLPFPHSEGAQSVFKHSNEDAAIVFAQEFTKLQGRFAFCTNEADLKIQLQQLLVEKNWTKIYFKGMCSKVSTSKAAATVRPRTSTTPPKPCAAHLRIARATWAIPTSRRTSRCRC